MAVKIHRTKQTSQVKSIIRVFYLNQRCESPCLPPFSVKYFIHVKTYGTITSQISEYKLSFSVSQINETRLGHACMRIIWWFECCPFSSISIDATDFKMIENHSFQSINTMQRRKELYKSMRGRVTVCLHVSMSASLCAFCKPVPSIHLQPSS